MSDICPICATKNAKIVPRGDGHAIQCVRCGRFNISDTAVEDEEHFKKDTRLRVVTSHIVRRMQVGGQIPKIDSYTLENIRLNERLPTAQEQIDNLILWLGRKLTFPNDRLEFTLGEACAQIGARGDIDSLKYIVTPLADAKVVNGGLVNPKLETDDPSATWWLGLTFLGWRRFEELNRLVLSSKIAFMAMKFRDEQLTACIKIASNRR